MIQLNPHIQDVDGHTGNMIRNTARIQCFSNEMFFLKYCSITLAHGQV